MTNESVSRPTIFELDRTMLNTVRGAPERLIREEECPGEVAVLGPLRPPPMPLSRLGGCIGGWYSGDVDPQVVVTGICQGSGKLEEKACWLKSGPSIETVCSLDAAFRIATLYPRSRLHIWIVDQEYANIVSDQSAFTSRPDVELEVGSMLEVWCRSRYPMAEVKRTSAPASRARLYGTMASGALASLYPQGVPHPYGNHGRVFWQEIQYLISVAAFADSVVNDAQRTLAVADHEQLRALAAARHVAGDDLAPFALWPCPRLGWIAPRVKADENSTRYAERLLFAIKNDKRRMYRAAGPQEILYANLSREQVAERLKGTDVSPATVRELYQFLLGSEQSPTLAADPLETLCEALVHAQVAPVAPAGSEF